MESNQFINLSESEQIATLQQPIGVNTPFYLERLKTALDTFNPSCLLVFSDELKQVYWELTSIYKRKK